MRFLVVVLTIASVIPRHIPDPPPVQKTTFPLKMSGLKIDVDSTIGTSYGEGDILHSGVGKLLGKKYVVVQKSQASRQRKYRSKSD